MYNKANPAAAKGMAMAASKRPTSKAADKAAKGMAMAQEKRGFKKGGMVKKGKK